MTTLRATELTIPPAVRRRVTKRPLASATESAARLIGAIEPGTEITGLTNGQFGLIDIIEHVLAEIGPADVAISTWTMGIYDADRCAAFCANGQISSIRWLVDPSMFGRRPELSVPLLRAFGAGAFRPVNTHAKFCTLVNAIAAVTIRSSMNLNPNRRMETFDITESRDLAAFFNAVVDDVFGRFDGDNRSQAVAQFVSILQSVEAAPATAQLLAPPLRRANVARLLDEATEIAGHLERLMDACAAWLDGGLTRAERTHEQQEMRGALAALRPKGSIKYVPGW